MASLFKTALFVLLFFQPALGAERVRIAVSSKSLGFFDVWAGREGGFFRKHGLEAEIIAMRPPLTIPALQAGEIDYTFGASTTLRAAAAGHPVKLASLSLRSTFHTLVARPAVRSVADLKGRVIAVTIGAADDVVARHLVRRAGLDPRDVIFISMAGSDARFQALLTGKIDATPLSLPYFVLARRQGFNILGTAADVLEMATVGLGTSARKLQENREQAKKMIRAQLETMRWIRSRKAEALQFLRTFFALDPEVAAESYELYTRLMTEDGRILPRAVRTVLEQEGKGQLPLERVADSAVVEEVLRERL